MPSLQNFQKSRIADEDLNDIIFRYPMLRSYAELSALLSSDLLSWDIKTYYLQSQALGAWESILSDIGIELTFLFLL